MPPATFPRAMRSPHSSFFIRRCTTPCTTPHTGSSTCRKFSICSRFSSRVHSPRARYCDKSTRHRQPSTLQHRCSREGPCPTRRSKCTRSSWDRPPHLQRLHLRRAVSPPLCQQHPVPLRQHHLRALLLHRQQRWRRRRKHRRSADGHRRRMQRVL